ncbi:hypothetical protein E4U54_002709 [Claviceps lovelessii]|nr:hypothetical protein E4U54_002709 [Claviceps lovelessii]
MSSIPPVQKLPLAVRKDVRDNWEAKKPDWEKKISHILRTPWTIDIDVHQIYAYATDGWAKECTGSMLNAYLESAEMQLKSFIAKHGDDARTEINALAHAHQLTMQLDTDNLVSCCGSQVIPTTGQLAILVQQAKLGTNVDDALGEGSLARALSGAPAVPSLPMSYLARKAIREDYSRDGGYAVAAVQKSMEEQLGRSVVLEPAFEENFEKLRAAEARGEAVSGWEGNLGGFVLRYFEGLARWMDENKVAADDMVREAVNEGLDSGTVAFRIVDELSDASLSCEAVLEGGVLCLQTVPGRFGTNMEQVADKLMERL